MCVPESAKDLAEKALLLLLSQMLSDFAERKS